MTFLFIRQIQIQEKINDWLRRAAEMYRIQDFLPVTKLSEKAPIPDRILTFSNLSRIGTPPTPRPQSSVPPPPFGSWGRGTLAGESGRVPIPTRGHLCILWSEQFKRVRIRKSVQVQSTTTVGTCASSSLISEAGPPRGRQYRGLRSAAGNRF